MVVALGYHVVSNYSSSPRPAPLEAGKAIPQDSNKVEFRLWQDPFEPFEPSTNQAASPKGGSDSSPSAPLLSLRGQLLNLSYQMDIGNRATNSAPVRKSLCSDIADHFKPPQTNMPTAIIGVMLPGGSYADDKEARLRLRYAVELAFLTGELGPEDRTHIHTNSMSLGSDGKDGPMTKYSYEWFKSRSDAADCQALVLWLNEDDFSDETAQRLNLLIRQIPYLTDTNKQVLFFLIGPRASDTLRDLDSPLDPVKAHDLIAAANAGHFQILSPEATAMVHDTTNNGYSWEFSSDHITQPMEILNYWLHPGDAVSEFLVTNLLYLRSNKPSNYQTSNSDDIRQFVCDGLNEAINTENFAAPKNFPIIAKLPPEITNLAPLIAGDLDVRHFNCSVLEAAYSDALAINQTSDPYALKLQQEFDKGFGLTNDTKNLHVFHTWVATDQRLSELIADELKNRLAGSPLDRSSNVVVILGEQDTYFGSRLADEWIDALVGSGVCASNNAIWQFSYLRGIDGSKPVTEKPREKTPDLASTPQEALQALEMEQQQNGVKADGDAQMDYIARLGEMLHKKDREMKKSGKGRIVAVGLTGSDAYDKLILLREMSHRLPEAVFFTTDLEAPLWTANVFRYSRKLLVASAYTVEPELTNNDWPRLEEFAPFRDVYQNAVFHACNAVVTNLWEARISSTNYDAPITLLQGSLWEIGRRGPVLLKSVEDPPPESERLLRRLFGFIEHRASAVWHYAPIGDFWILPPILGLLVLGLTVSRFISSSRAGVEWPDWHQPNQTWGLAGKIFDLAGRILGLASNAPGLIRSVADWARKRLGSIKTWFLYQARVRLGLAITPKNYPSTIVGRAQKSASRRQLSFAGLLFDIITPLLAGALVGSFLCRAWSIAQQPGEEPWNFLDGVSIWPSECLRLLTICGSLCFLRLVYGRLGYHRKRLWKLYFAEKEESSEDEWELFCKRREDQRKASGNRLTSRGVLAVLLLIPWIPRFVETETNGKTEASVDVRSLFRAYLFFGGLRFRMLRALISALLYFIFAFLLMICLQDIPPLLMIRGRGSHNFDAVVLMGTIAIVLFVLFYMLDAALLTKRILGCISLYPTKWPERPLRERASHFSVREEHLDGIFDVEFAAIQTQELGIWMFGPFVLLLLLVISRSALLDNWTWSLGLILIFVMNFLLGVICWFVVRRAAGKVRDFALEQIDKAESWVRSSLRKTIKIPANGTCISKKKYLKNLEELRKKILDENRGAYAPAFQDPSYLGVCIPSGISGIIIPLLSWWLSR